MSRKILIFIVMALGCLSWPAYAVDLVFDIDGTLFYTISAQSAAQKPNRTYQYKNFHYRMSDGAPEVLLKLQRQGFRLSTFSGGENERNDFLVQKLVEESAKISSTSLHFHRQLGFNDLSRRENPVSKRFTDTYMKDLRKVNPDLNEVVLIDDLLRFSAPDQVQNLLWISPAQTYENQMLGTPIDQENEKRKLFRAEEVLEEVLVESRTSKTSFVEVLSRHMSHLHASCVEIFR